METILVVDDEPEVRSVLAGMLREMGFTILEASSGPEALELSAKHRGEICLLLTDLIMPGMTGRLLADALLARRPGMGVIFMSGYVDDSRQEILEPGLHYIQKPVDWDKLGNKVKEALARGSRPHKQ